MVLAAVMLGLILVGVILSNIYGYYRPSWSVMRPVIKEASAFPHRPRPSPPIGGACKRDTG